MGRAQKSFCWGNTGENVPISILPTTKESDKKHRCHRRCHRMSNTTRPTYVLYAVEFVFVMRMSI